MEDVSLNLIESNDDAQRFMSWLGERRDWLGVDTETGGLDYWRDELRLVQIGDPMAGWAIPWTLWGGIAKEAIERYQGPTVMHNSKFDLHFLEHNGVQYNRRNLHDSMPMAGLLEPQYAKGLKPASARHVGSGARAGEKALKTAMSKGKWTWATVPLDLPEYWTYSALDPVLTSRLAATLYPQVQHHGLGTAYDYEVAVAQVLCDMETRGIRVDLDYSREISAKLGAQEDELYNWFRDELGIENPRSDNHLVTFFQTQGYEFTVLTDKGNIALDSDVLDHITITRMDLGPIAQAVVRLRDYRKMRVTYFDAFIDSADEFDRLHTSINPMGAITARMSSSRPNLQNIPARKHGKLVRDAFIPSDSNVIIAADFDQIEYRIMVDRAGEQQLIEAINRGDDLHTYMTSVVYKKPMEDVTPSERSVMKNATFAFLYGAGNAKFAVMAGISQVEAYAFRENYQKNFPAIAQYAESITSMGRAHGMITTGYLGRRQAVRDKSKAFKLLNYVTQGEAGDVLKKKMVELSMTEAGEYMILPIHDELLFDVPKDRADAVVEIIKEVMPEEHYYSVPLSVGVDVVDKWGDKYQ